MTQFSSRNHSWRATHEIFIWGQLALLAGVPWLWVMALRGLACGDLWLPPLLELWVLLVPTVGLTAWLQWSKPLSPFSWWFAAVPWQDLTENQLRVFDFLSPKTNPSLATGWLGVFVGITNVVVMSWFLRFLPSLQTESLIDNHFVGVTVALLCLWLANFWLQASVSALRILLAAKSIGEGTSFYTRESVPQDFTHLGIDDVLTKWLGVPKKQPFLPPATPPPIVIDSIAALERARLEAEQARLEAERLALEEQARLEAEQLEREKQARLEAERLALEEKARLEAERLEQEKQARLLAEQLEREKQARLLAEQLEREKQARLLAEQLEREKQARLKAERLALEEKARLEAERLAFEKAEQARLEAERLALAEKARLEAERLAFEKAEQARLEAEQLEREKQARLEAERLAFEKAEQARLEAERLEREKQAKLLAERLAFEIEKARIEQELLEFEAEQARLEAERLAFEKAEQARLEAERLEQEKQAKLLAERLALEEQAKVEPEPPAPPEITNHNELLSLTGDISSTVFGGDPDPDDPGAVPSPELIALIDQLLGTLKPDNQ